MGTGVRVDVDTGVGVEVGMRRGVEVGVGVGVAVELVLERGGRELLLLLETGSSIEVI